MPNGSPCDYVVRIGLGTIDNLISFQGDVYDDSAKLDITPAPDSILRVFMAYKPLDKPIEVPEQVFQPFERSGFTVVEWGGSAIGGRLG